MSPRSSRIGSRQRTNFSVETALEIYVRATEATDAPAIQNLVSHLTEELFGPFNVLSIIEKSLFAVTLVDFNDEVVGFAAFYDYPPVTAHVSPVEWPKVLNKELHLPDYNSLNTMFLHLFVTKADFAVGCAQEIVKSLFAAVPDVHQLLTCVPTGNHLDPAISDIFKPVNKTIKASSTSSASFYVCHRHEVSPVLHVRSAKMEDNDDLTPIFAKQNNQLQAVYGNYFVAELIDSQDEEHHALCAEKEGKAVGFMSLSTNVNLQLLNEAFELKPFHGLRKVHQGDVLEPHGAQCDSPNPEDVAGGEDSVEEVLEATVCLLASHETNKSTFLSNVHASHPETSKMTKDNDGCSRLTVDLESFDKAIKLTFIELPDIDKEKGLSPKQTALIEASDGIIFVYNASSASPMEDLLADFSDLIVSKDPNEDISAGGGEVDAATTKETEGVQSSADAVNSHTQGENTSLPVLPKGSKIKMLLADLTDIQEGAETWEASDSIKEFAGENGVGLCQAALSNSEAGQDVLAVVLETVARTRFALQTPSLPDEDSDSKSGANLIKPPVELVRPEPTFVPEYNGESNCFCIQLFCIKEDLETRSLDFMANAFQCYPDRDFCIITVPHMVPEFALLQNFVRVTPRVQSNLDQELYVFNRYGLLRDFCVRPSISSDFEEVEVLTKTIEGGDRILRDLKQYNEARRDKDGTPLHAFSACVEGGRVVGVAIVRQEEKIEYLKSWYNIEDFVYYSHHQRNEHGHLHHFVLNPIFHHLTKTFIKEIMRLDSKSCLYYPIFPTPTAECEEPNPEIEQHTLITCLGEMAPIRPRRQIVYPIHMLHGNVPSNRVLKEIDPFALYSINRKLLLEPKIGINARIVVVGASTTNLGFLETLVFSPHLRFNNITLVSPHGLPGDLPVSEEAKGLLSSSLSYPPEKLSRLSLRSWITVIQGTMIGIDRKSRRIHVRSSHSNQETGEEADAPQILSYDHLILGTGTQYEVPYPSGLCASLSDDELREQFPPPVNAWTVNDEYEADHFLHYIKTELLNADGFGHIIVYGSSVDAYCCLRVLLNCGVKGVKILFARKKLEPDEPTTFNNPLIDDAIDNLLREREVTIQDNCELYSWNLNDHGRVKEASFRVQDQWITYSCEAIICYDEKRVNYEAFRAINDSCLVFDSRVVIDSDFHTNDIAIRAAGPVTKFSRKYHADEWSHANFYSAEVGHELALTMLKLFDPTLDIDEEEYSLKQSQKHQLIPLYQKPKIVYCLLPGELHYLDVRKPKLPISIETARRNENYGKEYCTGTVNGANPRYFMLHVNKYNAIESLSCLSKEPVRCANLVCIYGRNEKLLNKLASRFSEGLIKDFYSYFDEPWAMALFHDRFEDLMQEIRDIITNTPPVAGAEDSEDASSFAQRVRTIIEENMEMKPSELSKLLTDFQSSGYKQAVETRLLAYLSYNYYHLPMYAKPGMV